jgi:hypothetical protein
MLALIHLSETALTHPPSIAALADLSAEHQLVLVCARCGPAVTVTSALRRAVPRRRVVSLAVDGEVVGQERRLVEDVLAEGHIVLILTADDPAAAALLVNWFWLPADRIMRLPGADAG